MATWKKVITEESISTASGLGSSDILVPSQHAVRTYVNTKKQKVDMQWSMRWYTSAFTSALGTARRRWYHPSSTYGPGYYNWNSNQAGTNSRTSWFDTYNPLIVIPRDMTLVGYKLYGNIGTTNSGNLIMDLKTNTNPITWDNDNGTQALSLVSNQVTTAWTGNTYNSMGEEDISVAMSAGDILIPMMCRDFALTTTSVYSVEGVFTLQFEENVT